MWSARELWHDATVGEPAARPPTRLTTRDRAGRGSGTDLRRAGAHAPPSGHSTPSTPDEETPDPGSHDAAVGSTPWGVMDASRSGLECARGRHRTAWDTPEVTAARPLPRATDQLRPEDGLDGRGDGDHAAGTER